jgi:hypothetical protein
MFHIENFLALDDEGDTELLYMKYRDQAEGDLSGPCDDDYEVTTDVGMLPDESDHPDGSPLDFHDQEYAWQYEQLLKRGF